MIKTELKFFNIANTVDAHMVLELREDIDRDVLHRMGVNVLPNRKTIAVGDKSNIIDCIARSTNYRILNIAEICETAEYMDIDITYDTRYQSTYEENYEVVMTEFVLNNI